MPLVRPLGAANDPAGPVRPIAHAAWQGSSVRAFVSPAFVGGLHPLARVAGLTNGIVIKGERGTQCYIGPGAGPDVTAATLLDDVAEVVTDRRVRTPSPSSTQDATSIVRPDSAWFLRLTGTVRPSTGLRTSDSDVEDLLGSYGIWCSRLSRRGDRTFVVTCPASHARVSSALDAVQSATGGTASAYPALLEDAAC